MNYRPDELDDPARTAPPPTWVPIEDGMELFRLPAWAEPTPTLQIWGQTPFGEFVLAVRPGTMEEDAPRLRASMCDGLYEEIYSIKPVDWRGDKKGADEG